MKFIFFGTPEFAAIIFKKLMDSGMVPVAIVTNPDKPAGRKKIITPPPIKLLVVEKGWQIDILQPDKLDADFEKDIKKYDADFFILAAYGKILPKWLIDLPPKGIVAIHPSLLPKYRGATPIQSVLLAGEKKTGTTLFVMDEQVDHGPIIVSRDLKVNDQDNYESLLKKLADLSGKLLIDILPKYLNGDIKPKEQEHNKATYTKKFTMEDAYVDLKKNDSITIWKKTRALNPEPGVWTWGHKKTALAKDAVRRERVKILEADLSDDGKLILKKIQREGKKPQLINW